MSYVVQVVEFNTKAIIKEIDCGDSLAKAKRTENGMNINLNHEEYFTSILNTDTGEEA